MATTPDQQRWHDTEVLPGSPAWHDTAVLAAPQTWHDTAVLAAPHAWQDAAVPDPRPVRIPPGWFEDPFGGRGLRYWDGTSWTACTSGSGRPLRRRSVALAFLLAFFFGGLALPYALPLPAWARLLIVGGVIWLVNWWLLLLVPLSWPFALILVPLLTALLNRRR